MTRASEWSCVHTARQCGSPARSVWRRGYVSILFYDVTQFTGFSRLLPLYYLWLQTPPRSSCFCYYQHDGPPNNFFPIWKLGSTRRSIASHPPHPSRPFVRPKISVSTVKHRLFVKTTFHQQPSVTTTITTTPSPLLLLPTTIHWQPVQAVQPSPN